ncbi:MAG: HAD-IIB family hydrolase [Betaproteobacteria bacterium]
MDDLVLRGMAKWPDVPAVHGWLSLDRRGQWRIRGERVSNPAVCAFIGRNYERDAEGRWFFQNGPQRVYVTLEYTPFVYRVVNQPGAPIALECHTGAPATAIRGAWMDEAGALLLETEHGIGLVHDRDVDDTFPYLIDANGGALDEAVLESLLDALQRHEEVPLWLRVRETNAIVAPIRARDVPQRFGFVPDPRPPDETPAAPGAPREPAAESMRPLQEFPDAIRRAIRGVLFDIDDTLTTEGRLTAAAYAAMERLQATGLRVIPITGRPAGWCDHIARMWPVDGMVGENGAFYFRYDHARRVMRRSFVDDDATRARHRARLREIAAEILAAVPGAAIAADQHYRETDLAIDYCEDVARLPPGAVERIAAMMRSRGLTAKVSSIHVNGWFGAYDKLATTRRMMLDCFGEDLERERARYVFIGDSPNDAPMFAFFPHAVGVANVRDFGARIERAPAYVTRARCGAGFRELVDFLLAPQ